MNTNTICGIPREEYLERVQRVQEEMKKEGLDAIIAFGHAAEPQYLRYFADFRDPRCGRRRAFDRPGNSGACADVESASAYPQDAGHARAGRTPL